jgi:hypothetical protein
MPRTLAMASCLLLSPLLSQDVPWLQAFAGYSNLQATYSGWEASLSFTPFSWLGLVADGSGYYAKTPEHFHGVLVNVNASAYAAMFGPEVSLHRGRARLFAHGLAAPGQVTAALPRLNISTGQTEGGYGGGGGLDVRLYRGLGVRLFQADYIRTHFGGQTQDLGRVSAGSVISLDRTNSGDY